MLRLVVRIVRSSESELRLNGLVSTLRQARLSVGTDLIASLENGHKVRIAWGPREAPWVSLDADAPQPAPVPFIASAAGVHAELSQP